jgi:hypothetical protein
MNVTLEQAPRTPAPGIIHTILIALTLMPVASSPVAAQHDFSGVRLFWRIADDLQRDVDPGAVVWDSLFATPGYAVLQERERRRPALMEGFRAALMPSRAGQFDSLPAGSWASRVAHHIRDVAGKRAALDAFAVQIGERDVLTNAIARAQTLLPAGTTHRIAPPAVAFLFFLPDGRGYPGLIVADLANVMRKSDPTEFFAHEVTHHYYSKLAAERRARNTATPNATQQALLVLLTKLHEESLGDQHDKMPWLEARAAGRPRGSLHVPQRHGYTGRRRNC